MNADNHAKDPHQHVKYSDMQEQVVTALTRYVAENFESTRQIGSRHLNQIKATVGNKTFLPRRGTSSH